MYDWSWSGIEAPPMEDSEIPSNPYCDNVAEIPSNPYCDQAQQTTADEAEAELEKEGNNEAQIREPKKQHAQRSC